MLAFVAFLLSDKGMPRNGMDMFAFALLTLAPLSALLAIGRAEIREGTSWLLLELRARKATLKQRIAQAERPRH